VVRSARADHRRRERGELAEQIRAAHSQPRGSLVLASWRTHKARLTRMREFEEAATAKWKRRKAEQADWNAAAMADPVERFYLRYGRQAVQEAQEQRSILNDGDSN
jgi:hypothetical protein